MVATNATLGVVFPHMSGLGGDAFWLIYDAKTRETHVLNASGRAAASATRERYVAGGATHIEPRGARAALTVPGAVDGWLEAHRRFGRLPLADCIDPAIQYAHDGFPVSPSLAWWSASSLELLRSCPATAVTYLKGDGSPYATGETLQNLPLARTLAAIAADGRAGFYEGPVAREIAGSLAQSGGVLTQQDLSSHHSSWLAPIQIGYRDRVIVNTPPNSQGFSILQILGMLEHFDIRSLAGRDSDYIDIVVRATELAFKDRDRYLTDPEFEHIPLEELLSPRHLESMADLLRHGHPFVESSSAVLAGDTTFSCAVDAEGNVAGVIQSIYFEWGSGFVAGKTGVLLHNRGSFFSLDPEHPNRLEPGKRTFHTLAAGMAFDRTGQPELVFGTMGGEGQPQTQVAILTRVIDHDYSVQEAIDAPRWLYGRTWGDEHRGLRMEARFGDRVAKDLIGRGHGNVKLVDPWTDLMGHAQAIRIFPNRLEGAADPRGDGVALGY